MELTLEEEVIKALSELGLTEKESYVYLLLLLKGPLRASEILEGVKVHQPQLYNILKNLIRKGFVKVVNGRPRLYAANDPEVIIERKESELKKYKELVKELIKRRSWERKAGVWITRGREGLIRNSIELIKHSKNELYLELPSSLATYLLNSVVKAVNRGVRAYLLFFPKVEEDALRKLSAISRNLNVKEKRIGEFFLLISDMETCTYAPKRYFTSRVNDDMYAIIFNEKEMPFFFMHRFFEAWRRGRPVISEELSPSLYPRKFLSHRMAVDEILRLREKGFRVEVEVKGKLIREERSVKVRGEVSSLVVTSEVVNFTLTVGKKEVRIGGYGSEVEDLEAEEITIVKVF